MLRLPLYVLNNQPGVETNNTYFAFIWYLILNWFFFRWVITEGEKYDIEYNVKMRDMQVTN